MLAEVTAAFTRYEQALVGNDVAVLDELFWNSPHTVRYGVTENLLRLRRDPGLPRARPSQGLARELLRTVITTYGRDFATANTEFRRAEATGGPAEPDLDAHAEGWRVVSAHVSLLDDPTAIPTPRTGTVYAHLLVSIPDPDLTTPPRSIP